MWGSAQREPLPAGLIIAAPYRPEAAWRPNIVLGARAVLPLIDSTVLARQESEAILRIAARIAPRWSRSRDPGPEAAEVAPRLLDLIDDALVSRVMETADRRSDGLVPDLAAVRRTELATTVPVPPAAPLRRLERCVPGLRYLRITDFLSTEERRRVLRSHRSLVDQIWFRDAGDRSMTAAKSRKTAMASAGRAHAFRGTRRGECLGLVRRAAARHACVTCERNSGPSWFPSGGSGAAAHRPY